MLLGARLIVTSTHQARRRLRFPHQAARGFLGVAADHPPQRRLRPRPVALALTEAVGVAQGLEIPAVPLPVVPEALAS